MSEHHIRVPKTARYFTAGEPDQPTRHLWIVCHGYGQLARFFVSQFDVLDRSHYVVAPEGLSRFYLQGFNGRVGATWMTREDRLNDIDDYVLYLDLLYDLVIKDLDRGRVKVHLLGFSQGAATATRWCAFGKPKFDSLILWSGLFPPDLPFKPKADKLKTARIFLVYGDDDPYMEEEKISRRTSLVKEAGIPFETVRFKGKHEVPPQALMYMQSAYPGTFGG